MIKVIKEGTLPKKIKIVYEETCPHCGCVFEFLLDDCSKMERHPNGHVFIDCPCCWKELSFKRDDLKYKRGVEENEH